MVEIAPTAQQQELAAKLQILPLEEDVGYINALFYGDVGAGKTHLLGTAADHDDTSPVIIFDVEGGLKTLRKFPNKTNIRRIVVRSMKELTEKYNILYAEFQRAIEAGEELPAKTIGIDSLTELADLDMKTIMKDAYARNPDKVDIDVPSQREWGKSRGHVRTIVRAFRDLPCNVIFTAHAGMQQEEGQPTKYFPGFAGKLRTEVPGFVDIVGYLKVETTGGSSLHRTLQVQGTNRVVAKDRLGVTENGILDNPTIPMMWEILNGTKPNGTSGS